MSAEFHITGFAAEMDAGGGSTQLVHGLIGMTGAFTSNIPEGQPLPTSGGIAFIPPRRFVIGGTGQFFEKLSDGSTADTSGVYLTSNDPGFGLGVPLQWKVQFDPFPIGGQLVTFDPWWFDAPESGWSGTIEELTPVPGIVQPGADRLGAVLAEAIAAADAAVDAKVEGLSLPQSYSADTTDYEIAIGDSDGRPTWMQADVNGGPTATAMGALAANGVPTSVEAVVSDAVLAIGDANGNPTWLQADSSGAPTRTAFGSMRQMLKLYVGSQQPNPDVSTGEYLWFKTDGNGVFLDILIGKA